MNKEEINKLIDEMTPNVFAYVICLAKSYEKLEDENRHLKSIIKKAKEYIYKNKEGTDYSGDRIIYLDEEQIKELLEILQGSDEQ